MKINIVVIPLKIVSQLEKILKTQILILINTPALIIIDFPYYYNEII